MFVICLNGLPTENLSVNCSSKSAEEGLNLALECYEYQSAIVGPVKMQSYLKFRNSN